MTITGSNDLLIAMLVAVLPRVALMTAVLAGPSALVTLPTGIVLGQFVGSLIALTSNRN